MKQTEERAQRSLAKAQKTSFYAWWDNFRKSTAATALLSLLIPAITTLTLEWIARGTLATNEKGIGFFPSLLGYPLSFLISYLLLVCVYVLISQLTRQHAVATVFVGLLGNVPAVVTYYKLTMRGEPFLPWDLSQVGDLMDVQDNISYAIQPSMVVTLVIFAALAVFAVFIKIPSKKQDKQKFIRRLIAAGAALAGGLVLMFGIFLNPSGTALVKIRPDAWMQDRYYRTNGVLTGFLTNLQLLNIAVPDGYSEKAVLAVAEETEKNAAKSSLYATSYAAAKSETEQTPNIIFVMAESFWDVTSLPGIEYDRELLTNFKALSAEGASGYAYTPSFGGGTCDVEFEALTGFSLEYLPAGSKPYQQYITGDTFSLPQYLKTLGYDTLAIHGYGRRFWNRDVAYPRLGIDTFIASDNFINPDKRRGFISDKAMVERIIEEYENITADGTPAFIHAVTMQNHTTYNRSRYPANELVRVTNAPNTIPDSTIGQLEDCATGIYEMDAALGELTDYLRQSDQPTIVVFWGDHLNPMSDGYALFEKTGAINAGDTSSPFLHKTPLLIWSNYADNQVDLGTLSTYNISPVTMDLYGLEKPLLFEFLTQQLSAVKARSHGIIIAADDTSSEEATDIQEEWFKKYGILQYNFLFGTPVLETYTAGG